jgi:hypothetical protein
MIASIGKCKNGCPFGDLVQALRSLLNYVSIELDEELKLFGERFSGKFRPPTYEGFQELGHGAFAYTQYPGHALLRRRVPIIENFECLNGFFPPIFEIESAKFVDFICHRGPRWK